VPPTAWSRGRAEDALAVGGFAAAGG